MKLSVKAFALAAGTLWGAAILCAGAGNAVFPPYGQAFLDAIASVYPGLGHLAGWGRAFAGAAYGFADGAVAAGLMAWIYNRVVGGGGAPA